MKATTQDRAVALFVGAAIGLLFGVAVLVAALLAATFYGPAWAALAHAHGPFRASLTVAAVTGAGAWVWFTAQHVKMHWNCTAEGCHADDEPSEG